MDIKLISFVIPCYNSTDTIENVVEEIICVVKEIGTFDYEIILTNDASPNGTTFDKIKQLCKKNNHIIGINLAKNFGQPSAVLAGMSFSRGDLVVCGDDDGQTPFCELKKFLDKINEGYDLVEAKFIKREKESWFRRFGTKMNEGMATWLIDKPKGIKLTTFFAVRRFVVNEMLRYKNAFPYLGGLMMRATQNVCNIEVEHRERIKGGSGYNIKKLMALWTNGFTAFSVKPLRITLLLGIIVAAIGFIGGVAVFINKLLNNDVAIGYSSLMCTMLFLIGLLFFVLGVMGEYIGRIYICLNNSPQYVIRETENIEIEDIKEFE